MRDGEGLGDSGCGSRESVFFIVTCQMPGLGAGPGTHQSMRATVTTPGQPIRVATAVHVTKGPNQVPLVHVGIRGHTGNQVQLFRDPVLCLNMTGILSDKQGPETSLNFSSIGFH